MARWRWLGSGEEVVFTTRRHPAELFLPVLVTGVVVALAALAGFVTGPDTGTDPVDVAAGIVAAAALVRLLVRVLHWSSYRLVVTDRRLVERSGVLSRRLGSLPLDRVADVSCRRSLGGRILGYGELILAGPDGGGIRRIQRIPHPGACYRALAEVLMGDLHESQWVPAAATRRPSADDADTGPLPRVVL